MPESHERWRHRALIPPSRPPSDTAGDEPVFARLMAEWRARGRTLPSRYDEEWRRIAGRDCWPDSGS
ncbi:hypothetical protein GTW43_13170 [Streptomyces sp. SID5785]|uniref:hypothetical protein n=1 Tax=Streptomyces sp. SID5785 TaxID=2690309 RepID=UPI001361B52F|nr:hypothetical protein [Streptomyces sp. SID5785]MZD06032.1 hypothetical protein [Streptomyces sp. SID5785]